MELTPEECSAVLNRAMAHWDEKHQAAWDSFHRTGSSEAMTEFYAEQARIASTGVSPS